MSIAGQLGLTDALSTEISAGGTIVDERALGLGAVRLTAALDVLSWVPELSLGAGFAAGQGATLLRMLGSVRLRRFVAPAWSWSVGLGAERRGSQWLGVLRLGLWWQWAG